MLNRRDVLSALTALPLFSIEKSIDNPPKDDAVDTNYSLCQILVLAREKNKSFRRKQWVGDMTIHHGMDNELISVIRNLEFTNFSVNVAFRCFVPSIADLLATDWELGESEYHYIISQHTVHETENTQYIAGKMGEWTYYNVKPTP